MGLHCRVETTEVHQHPLRPGFDRDGRATELFTQHGVARAEQRAATFRQQWWVILGQARQVLIEQQIDAVAPGPQIIHRGNPWCPAPGRRLPVMIEAIVVDDDPVEPRVLLKQLG
ncbi:hypothetical protein D3C71_1909040 [compost metagenome]